MMTDDPFGQDFDPDIFAGIDARGFYFHATGTVPETRDNHGS